MTPDVDTRANSPSRLAADGDQPRAERLGSAPARRGRRRLLIVSPHFPPINAPDHQRVRVALPHLAELGWDADVVAFRPEVVESARDPELLLTVPDVTPVTRVGAVPYQWTRRLGIGSLAWRGYRRLRQGCERLLRAEHFDVVLFSTTIFGVLPLGPRWHSRFRVPYVVDLQDPWVNPYYNRAGVRPPGGRLRFAVAQWTARRHEPEVMRQAAHVISVSPAYVADLRRRYPALPADRFTVLPFAARPADFDLARRLAIGQPVFDPDDGNRHWVYLGRGGPDMAPALRSLFTAVRMLRARRPEVERMRFHFVGTSYAPPHLAQKSVLPIAEACGVADLIRERTTRLPFLQGLAALQAAHTVLVIGSDDPGYNASKVQTCLAAGRPVLAVLHHASPACSALAGQPSTHVVGLSPDEPQSESSGRVAEAIEATLDRPEAGPPGHCGGRPTSPDRKMTEQLCKILTEATESV